MKEAKAMRVVEDMGIGIRDSGRAEVFNGGSY